MPVPRTLFPASRGSTASLAPWWPFTLVLHVAGVVVVVAVGNEGGAQTPGWGRGTRGLVLFSPPSWSLMTRLPVTGAHSCPSHWLISLWGGAVGEASAQEKRELRPSK